MARGLVSYRIERRHRLGRLTMRAYFDLHHVNGRAVLRGTEDFPKTWIAQVGDHLVVCSEDTIGVRRVHDDDRVPGFAVYDQRTSYVIH